MEHKEVNCILEQLFDAHEIKYAKHQDWILPGGKLPAIRANWSEKGENEVGQLQVQVALSKELILEENFAGIPSGEGKLKDAFMGFSQNVFHVLLDALWGVDQSEHIVKYEIEIKGELYTFYFGTLGHRGSEATKDLVPHNVEEAIEAAVRKSEMNEDINWFRMYYGNVNADKRIFEVLHNNELWYEGIEEVQQLNWKETEEFYSIRGFVMLKRNDYEV